MREESWRSFRERYPDAAQEMCRLGTTLYEMGVSKADGSKELSRLMTLVRGLPREAFELLEIEGTPENTSEVLTAVIDLASRSLIRYVQGRA